MQEIILENKETYIPAYKYAKLFGVTKQTVYRWIKSGKIDKNKIRYKAIKRIEILAP